MLSRVVLGLALGGVGICDVRTRKVSMPILIGGVLVLLALSPWNEGVDGRAMLGGVFLGLTLSLVSMVSGGRMGFGDGLVFCMTGVCLGFWENLTLMSLSFLFAGIFGAVGLLMKKLTMRQRIPFVPFVVVGYLGTLCL